MLKKTIKYEDFDGNQREEDFYFNLTKAELMEMELSVNGGLEKELKRIISTQDSAGIIDVFKRIILMAYGVKDPDGRGFKKSEELRNEFKSTMAYNDLFMELATDADAATKFITGIMPKDMDLENIVKNTDIKAIPTNN